MFLNYEVVYTNFGWKNINISTTFRLHYPYSKFQSISLYNHDFVMINESLDSKTYYRV